ncbi:MAG: hypothetical protein NT012_00155 [Candidatus Nealsonbacteria bacterium]|nr:hypothetical protein [Candidatus Nealsonbacteria bacterium]
MIETIKEKLKSAISFFKTREFSERSALLTTILAFVLILVVFFLIIRVVLPRTKVEINISGPETAKVGEEITYTVTCKNTGNVVLKNPELVFNYPSFSLPEKSLIETIILGESLYPNEEKVLNFKAQLFGTEGERREAKTWLNYSKGKQPAIKMSKVANFSSLISEVPIDFILDIPKKIPISPKTETEFIFRLRYFSLIDHTISNLKLSINFPFDFTFKESMPPKTEEQKWEIPKLEYLGGKEAEITGSFPQGQEIGKELDFSAQLFINLNGQDVLLKEVSARSVTYEPNFLFSQKINNQEKYFPYSGERLYYEIYFKNIQDKPLRDLVLTTVLEGNLYDLSTIETPLGEFPKGGNSISWNGEKIPQLRYLTPGEEGKVEFWVQLKEDFKPKDLTETNALIKNRVILAGFEAEFRNRVNSQIKISQEGYFKDKYGFFENPGQHPPQVNETTNYTIVWKLENYYNWIENAIIKATLPSGVYFRSVKPTHGEMKVITDPLQMKGSYPEIPTTFRFEKPLYEGLSSEEVRYLQIILKREVPYWYPANVPTTGYFGRTTLAAVKGFQEKYRKEILESQNLENPTGYVDEVTRLKLNELLIKGMPLGPTEVIWEIENINPGVGVLEDPWIAAFQIAFVPDLIQRGKIATLINEVIFSAKDQWTEMIVSSSDEPIDTTLPDDLTVEKVGKIR